MKNGLIEILLDAGCTVTGTGCGAFYTCYCFTSPVVIGGVEYGVCAFGFRSSMVSFVSG